MANNNSNIDFFILPPELRLHVYSYILSSALADGNPTDISGILLSCRTTAHELTPMIAQIRVLLDIQHKYRTHRLQHGSLQFQLPPSYNFIGAPSHLDIDVAIWWTEDTPRWLAWAFQLYGRKDFTVLDLLNCILLATHLPHSGSSITFRMAPDFQISIERSGDPLYYLLSRHASDYHILKAGRIDRFRVVLNPVPVQKRGRLNPRTETTQETMERFLRDEALCMREFVRYWATRRKVGRRVACGYGWDFRELPEWEPEGLAFWNDEVGDRWLRGIRKQWK